MTIQEVNKTFRLWSRPTDGSERDAIRFSQERMELGTVISMVLEPEMMEELFSKIPGQLLEQDPEQP